MRAPQQTVSVPLRSVARGSCEEVQTQTSQSARLHEVSHFVGHWMLLDRAPPVVSSLQGRAALFHLCYICAIASLDLDAEAYAQSAEEFLEERRHAFQRRQMRPGAVMAAGAGIWRRGLNDLGLTPSPGCAAPTEVMQVQRNSWQNDGRHPVETNAP